MLIIMQQEIKLTEENKKNSIANYIIRLVEVDEIKNFLKSINVP